MGDLVLALRAHKQTAKEQRILTAWHAALLMNLVVKPKVRIEDLVPDMRGPVVFRVSQFGGDIEKMKAAIAAQQAKWDAEDQSEAERSYFDG
jgi:hypothetical protein